MMKSKTIFSALLAAMMIAATLTSCGDSSSNSENSTATDDTSSKTVEADTFTGYPMQTDETISFWVAGQLTPQTCYKDYTESPFHTGLAEATGINVEWQFPAAGTDNYQAFNLLIASNDLPDIIFFPMISSAQQYIDDKLLRDLTAEMPVYSPNYWEFVQQNPHYDKSIKTDSGQYWGYGSFREEPKFASYVGPVVRQDWLDEQGLETPQTIEDWDKTIRAFHDAYGAQLAFFTARMNPGFASAFGAYTTFNTTIYIDDEGKAQYAMAQPEWKEYMQQLNTWYMDGLIDPDSITLDDAGMRSKALNNKVGVSCTALSQLTNWNLDATSNGTGAKWVGAPYLPDENGVICTIQSEDTVSPYMAGVTTACSDEKLPIALRWLDYGYTDEGYMYWNFGTEGDTYEIVDGVPTYTEKVTGDPEGMNVAMPKYMGTTGAGLCVQAGASVYQRIGECSTAIDVWGAENEAQEHLLPAGISFTTEESTELSTISNTINTYASEMALKYLTGEESLDNFDQFVQTLNEMGLPRVLEINQAAYERFLAR